MFSPKVLGVMRKKRSDGFLFIEIVPELGFGRPVVKGTGIVAEEIANRNRGGDSIVELSKDYGLTEGVIRGVLREVQRIYLYWASTRRP